jgi:hypothetical protein
MLQGVGSRFDFHINKTLCDLRFVCFECAFLKLSAPLIYISIKDKGDFRYYHRFSGFDWDTA